MNHLPLTLPLRYLGMSDAEVDQIDSVLQPQIDAAYARNDNWFTRPVSVDPVRGLDPLTARARSWKVPAAYWAPRLRRLNTTALIRLPRLEIPSSCALTSGLTSGLLRVRTAAKGVRATNLRVRAAWPWQAR